MWSSLPPAPPGEEGLQLTDSSYNSLPSPCSPSTPSYTFQRVQAIKQNISKSTEQQKEGKLWYLFRLNGKYWLLLLFATTRSVFKSVTVSVVEIAKRTN